MNRTFENENQMPWYDSSWITAYLQARRIIQTVAPKKLQDFEATMQVLRVPANFNVLHLKCFISRDLQQELIDLIASLPAERMERHEFMRMGRLVVHDHPRFNCLQQQFTDLVSEAVNEEVEPAYNFLSLYNNLGVCEPHMDAPSAKWTLDLCVRQSAPWPIHISQVRPWPEEEPMYAMEDWQHAIKDDSALTFTPHVMEERDAILFAGSSQWHYRDRIPRMGNQNFCHLVFFHYIPKGSGALHSPAAWPELFGVKELGVIKSGLPTFGVQEPT